MKTAALRKLRRQLAEGAPAYGLWVTLESPSITEMAVGLGLDWVVVDAEHGHLDWKDIVEHTRAAVRSDTVVLVRIAEPPRPPSTPGERGTGEAAIKRALDIGADGIVVPWVETPEQLAQAVAFARYPPAGQRGMGAERATAWGQALPQHVAESSEVLVVPIVESVRGAKNIEALCGVAGVELFWLGPADFSATAGFPGQWEGPGVAEQLLAVKDCVRRHGKHCGVVATSLDNLTQRRQQGFSCLALGADSGLLLRSLHAALAHVGRDRKLNAALDPSTDDASRAASDSRSESATTPPVPLELPEIPKGFEPDRPEVMTRLGDGPRLEIAPGVIFRSLVGDHNRARNLTTGIVTFAAGSALPYHTHPFAESVTLLEGQADFRVEGRRYRLLPLDNVVVPRDIAHAVLNQSEDHPAVFHIAMASHTPTRTLVERPFPESDISSDDYQGAGPELVNWHASTPWYEPSPHARFQDFFNREMGCPEMSGGYGLFAPSARLPCHLHDFDESICIVQGTATCVVEGQRYTLSDSATALVPRGRCHYFINHTDQPMAMIWVYAGPMPERIVMKEKCCGGGEVASSQ